MIRIHPHQPEENQNSAPFRKWPHAVVTTLENLGKKIP
jgi:hypothetical protein